MAYISPEVQARIVVGLFVKRIESRCTSPHKARLIELARTADPNGYILIAKKDAQTRALIDSGDVVAYKGIYKLNKKYRQDRYIGE